MGLSDGVLEDASLPSQPRSRSGQPAGVAKLDDVSRKLLALCLFYILGAALIWPSMYSGVAQIYLSELVAGGPICFFAVMIPAAIIISPKAPIGFIVTLVRANGMRAALVVTVFILLLAAYTTCKVNIPEIVPFYSDEALADLDELLHGQAPWQIAHAFDSDTLALVIGTTYSKIWFLEWFGMVFFAALCSNQLMHLRYLAALALVTMVVGTLLATLFSSVGPIFYDEFLGGDRYAELLKVVRQHNQLALRYSHYLLASYKANMPALGSGISAMPSMHVAIATLNAFYLARLNRWLGVAGWAFAIFILFGSFYTGWHYAVDGYISMLVVAVIWRRTAGIADIKTGTSGSTTDAPDRQFL
ncbi:phosphatase PAP2 family protein [Mesorhizobium sp. WSM4884]|uniref:phosphatase PAP2 family protein n=1 Tax=Mesorhizobium sp. WSM4884 TaxID=3038542 RepID=UPI002415D580|nr:phosphatase PAP2 family protein [Mesorhizobium sp. WSM4884]MDG4882302.1 phosphatase PAP2 family protein [Mesorhizobium sp. WSM4884]